MTTVATLTLWCFLTATNPAETAADGGVAPPPVASPAPSGDAELRARLDQALELLQKHEVELEALRKAKTPPPPPPSTAPAAPASSHWYERIKLRGYTQVRYNAPGVVYNDKLINDQGDKSMGGNGGFFIRRARLILMGDLHPRVSFYFQPDFASSIGEQLNVTIIRDLYVDVYLDEKKDFRVRIGQSKVPFGFENMQSSSNRLPLDRNDPLNSAVKDERDIGVFLYWTPAVARERFKMFVDANLKGSGDYGVFALGVYNGQTANKIELNKFPHVVARATYPFAIGDQFLELGVAGHYGLYTVTLGNLPDGTKAGSARSDNTFTDARGAVTAVLYPKPFGVMFEYNVGVGPQLGTSNLVNTDLLYGGYATLSYKIDEPFGTVSLIPFVRGSMYDGGKKFFTNAPRYHIREVELGVEWQIFKAFELTLAYNISERTSDKTYQQEYGHWTRIQAQFNY